MTGQDYVAFCNFAFGQSRNATVASDGLQNCLGDRPEHQCIATDTESYANDLPETVGGYEIIVRHDVLHSEIEERMTAQKSSVGRA